MESFTSAIQTLIINNKDFPKKFKQRLVFEAYNVTNPLKFIVGLITEGVLSDESSDTEASVGLKEMVVQLAMMIVCSKGADAIRGFTKALEESGNLHLISALRTWVKDDFAIETDDDLSKPKGAPAVHPKKSKRQRKKKTEILIEYSLNAQRLLDMIMSHLKDDFMEQLEGHWIGRASKIVNVPEFCSSLAHPTEVNESEVLQKNGMEWKQEQQAQKVIEAAVSKRAIASLVLALQLSGNDSFLQETQEWLETSQVGQKNYPVAVTSLPNQLKHQKPTVAMSQFFDQAPPTNDLQKVATFNCSPELFAKKKSVLRFIKEKMVASFATGTVKLWNWRENKATTMKLDDKVKGLTGFEYDEEIVVLGTAAGTVHLFDAKTMEEKWSDRLGEPVDSVKIVESTLLAVVTQSGNEDKLWCVEISRSDMRLRNRRPVMILSKDKNYGLLIDQSCFFLYHSNIASMQYLSSGEHVKNENGRLCSLEAPAVISTLNVVKLIQKTPFVVAGCKNGAIGIWYRYIQLGPQRKPFKTFHGHQEAIVGLCGINGHLVSLCQGGKLLMWSGPDMENQHVTPIPRVLAANFPNVTCLVACERWLASSSPGDGIVNIWTLPDLWLRTG